MRQRNVSGGPLVVPSIPAEVPDGGVVDWPGMVCGFEIDNEPEPDPPTPPAPVRKSARSSEAAASSTEEA